MRSTAVTPLSALVSATSAFAQKPTRPDVFLGRPLGADFQLPDWDQVRGYFEKLDQESARVELRKVGTTTEGRDFVLAVISSEENLARLDELRRHAALCHDPRGATREQRLAAVEQGRPFVFVSCAMHATECASPQFAMQMAWELATSDDEPWKQARERTVVLLAPSLNPDGLDIVVDWYRKTVNTPYEASELPKLYQHYCGHDNNRDWFALTQKETRIVTEQLYSVWKPQVYWDVHQQGSRQERMFVPPFRDPLDPNLDPAIVCGMNVLGTRAQFDMTREGKTGVATGGTYDMWWNGGNRNVPVRHNVVGLLTEAASCRLASPIFLQRSELRSPTGAAEYGPSNAFPAPWPGGWWRIADIIAYELAFARSLLGSVAREPRSWLANQMEAADRTLRRDVPGMPEAWVVPSSNADRGAMLRLADVLIASGIELDVASGAFDAGGRAWPAGSFVISAAQPYARHVKDLFETQAYPPGDPPYDVAGWTLPALFGVEAAELREPVETGLARAKDVADARKQLEALAPRKGEGLSMRDSDAWKSLFARLAKGERFQRAAHGERAEEFVRAEAPAGAQRGDGGAAPREPAWTFTRAPRVALYSPWSGNMDEGWMRWVLDTFGVPYVVARNEALRAGRLSDAYDVLLLPGVSANDLDQGRREGSTFDELAGGLDPEGAIAVEEFVRGGGTVVAVGNSCAWAIDLFDLPVEETTKLEKEFSCPGSVLRAIPERNPFTTGLDESIAVFGASPKAYAVLSDKEREAKKTGAQQVEVLLRYAPTRTLLSGYLMKPEALAGHAAWLRARHGEGYVHLFGFRPQYRGWSQSTFQLLFRALLFDGGGG
jgi:hypothetical protein